MLSILARTFKAATRQENWDSPEYWSAHQRPISRRHAAQIEAERKVAQLRNVGMW